MVVGQGDVIRQLLPCLAAGGHGLLEGPAGVGKSLLVQSLGVAYGLAFTHVHLTPDLTPGDLLEGLAAASRAASKEEAPPVRLFANLVLADEIDRCTPRVQSCLLEAMQKQTITVAGNTWPLPSPFAVVATQGPSTLEGPHPLSEKQLDHFLMKLIVHFPSASDLARIVGRTTGAGRPWPRRIGDAKALSELVHLVRQVPIARHVTDYAVRLVLASRPEHPSAPPLVRQHLTSGASPRGAQTLVLAAKAAALIDGRYNVSFGDVRQVALPSLRHRLIRTEDSREAGVDVDVIVKQLLDTIREEP